MCRVLDDMSLGRVKERERAGKCVEGGSEGRAIGCVDRPSKGPRQKKVNRPIKAWLFLREGRNKVTHHGPSLLSLALVRVLAKGSIGPELNARFCRILYHPMSLDGKSLHESSKIGVMNQSYSWPS